MSHTNSTANYNLPQFITTDKPAWLTDVNNAYSAIDIGIKAAKDAGDNAQADATQALTDSGNAQTAANTAGAKASGAIASISEDFLDSAVYAVGDLVMYNNLLYRCHTAVTTPGAWTGSTNWTRTDIDSLLGEKPSSLSGLTDTDIENIANGQILVYTSGKWHNTYLLQYVPSQAINLEDIWCTGYQGSSTVRAFFIPLTKPVSSLVSSATLSNVYVSAYTASGPSETWSNQLLSSALGTITTKITEGGILVSIILNSALSTPTYTPLTIRIVSGVLNFN